MALGTAPSTLQPAWPLRPGGNGEWVYAFGEQPVTKSIFLLWTEDTRPRVIRRWELTTGAFPESAGGPGWQRAALCPGGFRPCQG